MIEFTGLWKDPDEVKRDLAILETEYTASSRIQETDIQTKFTGFQETLTSQINEIDQRILHMGVDARDPKGFTLADLIRMKSVLETQRTHVNKMLTNVSLHSMEANKIQMYTELLKTIQTTTVQAQKMNAKYKPQDIQQMMKEAKQSQQLTSSLSTLLHTQMEAALDPIDVEADRKAQEQMDQDIASRIELEVASWPLPNSMWINTDMKNPLTLPSDRG
jgi:hypothetical protein